MIHGQFTAKLFKELYANKDPFQKKLSNGLCLTLDVGDERGKIFVRLVAGGGRSCRPLRSSTSLGPSAFADPGLQVWRNCADLASGSYQGASLLVTICVKRSLKKHCPPCKHSTLAPSHPIPQLVQLLLLPPLASSHLWNCHLAFPVQHLNWHHGPPHRRLTVVFFRIVVANKSITSR